MLRQALRAAQSRRLAEGAAWRTAGDGVLKNGFDAMLLPRVTRPTQIGRAASQPDRSTVRWPPAPTTAC